MKLLVLATLLSIRPAVLYAMGGAAETLEHMKKNRDAIAERQRKQMLLEKHYNIDIVADPGPNGEMPIDRSIGRLQGMEDERLEREALEDARLTIGAEESDKAFLSTHVDDGSGIDPIQLSGMSALDQAKRQSVNEVGSDSVLSIDPETGEITEADPNEWRDEIERRIEAIIISKVDAGAAQAVRGLLWSAAFPCFADRKFSSPHPKYNPVLSTVLSSLGAWFKLACGRLRDPYDPAAGFPTIEKDNQSVKYPVLATYTPGAQEIRYNDAAAQVGLFDVLCHELDHFGDDLTGLNQNEYTGDHCWGEGCNPESQETWGYQLVAEKGHPKFRAPTEKDAYTNMGLCGNGYQFMPDFPEKGGLSPV